MCACVRAYKWMYVCVRVYVYVGIIIEWGSRFHGYFSAKVLVIVKKRNLHSFSTLTVII